MSIKAEELRKPAFIFEYAKTKAKISCPVFVIVVLGFYIPPTETVPRFQVSSERLEKPRIELMTHGLQGK